TKVEAEALANAKLLAPSHVGASCTYNSNPSGTPAQVFLFVSSTVPQTLLTDRRLHHQFWTVPKLGEKAVEEEWAIFVLQGGVWLTMSLVRIDDWTPYKQRLVTAARLALSRMGQAMPPKAAPEPPAATRMPAPAVTTPPDDHVDFPIKWTGKERTYGGSIGHYPGVVYQPAVVVIGGGANAIRGRSNSGLT